MPLAVFTLRRRPAVSTNRQSSPPRVTRESTGSTVVPATESTTERSSLFSRLIRLDLPTLGRPTSATRRGPPTSSVSRGASGIASSTRSSRSPLPQPQRPELGGTGLAALVVDLVGHQDHRAVAAPQHPGGGQVGLGRPHCGV